MRCPCCGQFFDNGGIIVDLNTNTIIANGTTVLLYPIAAELAWILLKYMPAMVRFDVLTKAIWGLDAPDPHRLTQHAHHLRKRIACLGLDVVGTRSIFAPGGYRLVQTDTALVTLAKRYQRHSLPLPS